MNAPTFPVTIEIRRMVPADWAALREIRLAALADAPDAFSSTPERELGFDEARWRERLEQTAHFGAWRSGRLVGLAAGFPESAGDAGGPDSAPPDGWHLVSMWVSPQERGQGLADRLVASVCELARAEGASQISLWVTEVNPRARAFYQRVGFRATGDRQLVRPEEPGHWEERMSRALP